MAVTVAEDEEGAWMQTYEESLFYRVPRRIVSYVEGGRPSRLQMFNLDFVEEEDSVVFKVVDLVPSKESDSVKIKVPLPKIFKLIENMGLSVDIFDEDLYAVKYRYNIITKVIS